MRGTCVKGCPDPQMTYFTYKVYRNLIDFSFSKIVWTEVNITDDFFLCRKNFFNIIFFE